MTGNETKIEVTNPWVADLTKPNLDTTGITEAYGRGLRPEIMFKAADSNSAPIYIAENTGDSADKQFPLCCFQINILLLTDNNICYNKVIKDLYRRK